jgi:Electron transfer DM13
MSIFGDIERLAADLYPYRVPISLGALLVLAAIVAVGYRRGWHRTLARHKRATVAAVAVALFVLVPVGLYTLSPLWTRTELNEVSPLEAAAAGGAATPAPAAAGGSFVPRVAYSGEFRGADDLHFGRGQAQLIETAPGTYTLRFERFSVLNGPDLYVYLSPSADGYAEGVLELGELKATDGAFNYEIPPGTDVGRYKSVIVWCRPFTVLFASAPLLPA